MLALISEGMNAKCLRGWSTNKKQVIELDSIETAALRAKLEVQKYLSYSLDSTNNGTFGNRFYSDTTRTIHSNDIAIDDSGSKYLLTKELSRGLKSWDVGKWWVVHEEQFPTIAVLAKRHFDIAGYSFFSKDLTKSVAALIKLATVDGINSTN